MSDPREKPPGHKDDPNLGQKEAEEEKTEFEEEEHGDEQDDELEPMTDRSK